MKRFAAYKQGVGDPDQRLAGCGRIRNGHWRGFGGGTNGLPDLGLEVPRHIEGVEFYEHQEQIEEVPE
jgi:hypothetical protein